MRSYSSGHHSVFLRLGDSLHNMVQLLVLLKLWLVGRNSRSNAGSDYLPLPAKGDIR